MRVVRDRFAVHRRQAGSYLYRADSVGAGLPAMGREAPLTHLRITTGPKALILH